MRVLRIQNRNNSTYVMRMLSNQTPLEQFVKSSPRRCIFNKKKIFTPLHKYIVTMFTSMFYKY